MKYTRGRPLEPGEKQAILLVKSYFDRNKKEFGLGESSVQLTSDVLEVGVSTVKRVMADFRRDPALLTKPPEPKGRPGYRIDGSHEERVRQYIREANQNGQHITLAMIAEFIQGPHPESRFHLSTLSRTLDRWGFEFGPGKRSQHLKEKDEMVVARQRYLRRMRANRGREGIPIKPEIYLDESYVNKNHSNDFTWYSGEDGPWLQKPTGKGERLIIVNAISREGWVEGAQLVFQAKKKTGDYHGQMNAELFQKWFGGQLLPNLSESSLIVMDNAPYHNVLSACSPPTPASSKGTLRTWLLENGMPCEPDCLRAELVMILKKLAPLPLYAVDEMAKKHGHEVIRTPPYHPELQPIEICWGIVKNHIARHSDFTLSNLKRQLDEGFTKVKPSTCAKIIRDIKEKEDDFWIGDAKFDPTE